MKKIVLGLLCALPFTSFAGAGNPSHNAQVACSELARMFDYNGYYQDIVVKEAKNYRSNIYLCMFKGKDTLNDYEYQDRKSFYVMYDTLTGAHTKLD